VPAPDLSALLRAQNAGRDPKLLAAKYAAMRATPFAFFRATCGLFYTRAAAHHLLPKAPLGWLCGDLHLENFGAYRGENGLAYFDLNDFDEALLAPGTWDILRLTASVVVWAGQREHSAREQKRLAQIPLEAFDTALRAGRARWLERATAEGPIRKLLRQVERRTQQDLLDQRTAQGGKHGTRRLLRVPGQLLPAPPGEKLRVVRALARFARRAHAQSYYRVLDVTRRIAGLGSLGLPRWVILVEGDGSPDGNRLLDLKAAHLPTALPWAGVRQVRFGSEAERVVQVQQWLEAEPPALLAALGTGKGFILRELQPRKDRLRLAQLEEDPHRATSALQAMGRLAGWALLRGAGRRGAAGVDQWMVWARKPAWRRQLLANAVELARLVQDDWRAFSTGYDGGAFGGPRSQENG
jgi:uncharacterized protein (DUF2252 family)